MSADDSLMLLVGSAMAVASVIGWALGYLQREITEWVERRTTRHSEEAS